MNVSSFFFLLIYKVVSPVTDSSVSKIIGIGQGAESGVYLGLLIKERLRDWLVLLTCASQCRVLCTWLFSFKCSFRQSPRPACDCDNCLVGLKGEWSLNFFLVVPSTLNQFATDHPSSPWEATWTLNTILFYFSSWKGSIDGILSPSPFPLNWLGRMLSIYPARYVSLLTPIRVWIRRHFLGLPNYLYGKPCKSCKSWKSTWNWWRDYIPEYQFGIIPYKNDPVKQWVCRFTKAQR